MSVNLYLKQMVLGSMANCVYLLGCREKNECVVVDPAWEIDTILAQARADGMTITGILATHYHPDHVGSRQCGFDIPGIADLLEHLQVPVYAHKLEIEGICKVSGVSTREIRACSGGDCIQVGNIEVVTIHTPGHTPGSQCFALADNLVSGDTLFISGCGRVDLPGGDVDQLYDSLTQKIKKLPPATTVLPGHHYGSEKSATLAHVLTVNPYLQVETRQDFKDMRNPS